MGESVASQFPGAHGLHVRSSCRAGILSVSKRPPLVCHCRPVADSAMAMVTADNSTVGLSPNSGTRDRRASHRFRVRPKGA